MRIKGKVGLAAAVAAVTVLSTGCLGGGSSKSASSTGTAGANKNTSKNVTILTGLDQPVIDAMKAALQPYLDQSGIKVTWTRTTDFNNQIQVKVKANQTPDIGLFPQPGILVSLAKQGKLAPMDSFLDIPTIKSQVVSGLLDPATVDGKVYGIPPSINVKSLVYYPKKAFQAAGYTIPTTLDELTALTNKIKASGTTPWCIGIESGTATGWPATDWLEDLVMRYGGLATYNQWINHTVKFDSPVVKQAADYYQSIFATPGFVNGGQKAIAGNNFGTAGNPMFADKPGCLLFKQGSFITGKGFFPDKVLADIDNQVGVFYLPGKTATDKPVEGGGDVAGLFSGNNDSAKAVLKQMFTPNFCADCAKASSYMSPFKSYSTSNYANKLTAQMASIAYQATGFGFDASDSMPAVVGTGSFWKQMTAWINGSENEQTALKNIDSSWPTQ